MFRLLQGCMYTRKNKTVEISMQVGYVIVGGGGYCVCAFKQTESVIQELGGNTFQ